MLVVTVLPSSIAFLVASSTSSMRPFTRVIGIDGLSSFVDVTTLIASITFDAFTLSATVALKYSRDSSSSS